MGIRVINVYVPNGGTVGSEKFSYKLGWLADLAHWLQTHHDPRQPLLICGDFNIAPEAKDVFDVAAMTNEIGFHPLEHEALGQLRTWGLTDTFRLLHPETQEFSWWDYRAESFRRNRGLRIDQLWVTPTLAQRCTHAWIDREPRTLEKPSDHVPVGAKFAWDSELY